MSLEESVISKLGCPPTMVYGDHCDGQTCGNCWRSHLAWLECLDTPEVDNESDED